MSVWRLALTRRWLGYLAVAVVFAVVTSLFGLWQWDRREQAVEEISRITTNSSQTPVPFEQLLPPDREWDPSLKWRPVELTGKYRSDETLLVRTRPRSGQVGFAVLVPFRTVSGHVVVVDRGWIPTGTTGDAPDIIPEPPEGAVTLVATVFPGEPEVPGRSAPEGQIATIHLPTVEQVTGLPVDQRAYLQMVRESPDVTPRPLPPLAPVLDEGPHLSYSLQWFLFGLLGFFAWGYLLRQEHLRSQGLPVQKERRRRSDADEEDDLLDRTSR